MFVFGCSVHAPLAALLKPSPDDGYLVAIEPLSERETPTTAVGGTETVVAAAVDLPDRRMLVVDEMGQIGQSP